MRIDLSIEARTHIARVDAWWRANRPSAPDLFMKELHEALLALGTMPSLGVRYKSKPNVRRLLLNRSRQQVYFKEEPERILVVAVWGTQRRYGPPIKG